MESPKLYALAGVGALQGAYRYYLRPELTAKRMWGAIGASVLAYELACPENELLSEGVDRALDSRYSTVVRVGVAVTALHLVNLLPERIDPFHQGLKLIKGNSGN